MGVAESIMHALQPSDDPRAALAALPDGVNGELIDGALHVSPRPASPHAFTASEAGADLLFRFQRGNNGPGGWWILHEPELHLGDDVLIPDLAGWRRTTMPYIPDVPAFTLRPDWLAEVLSPSTERLDRLHKLHSYARHGVPYLWLLNPILRTVEVFHLQHGKFALIQTADGDDTAARLEPFHDVPLDLTLWWRPEPPPLLAVPSAAHAP